MATTAQQKIIYPERDGRPIADNTLQFRWIVLIKENLEWLLAERPDVFVAGDLLWYPVEGRPEIRTAPGVMVVFGRPKGDRGSYRQWEEDNIAPQVVFEILSPGNRLTDMVKKLDFYERYGVEEYYIYDPQINEGSGFVRRGLELEPLESLDGWVSPRLGVRFACQLDELVIYAPRGERFKTTVEWVQQAEQERQRAERLAAYLRSQGIDPEAIA